MIKNTSNIIIIVVVALSISIIFSLPTITTIEPTYANHTKYHLNNSLVDVTISSDDDIPDALLEDIKRGIIRDMKAEEKKSFEKDNNISQLQTTEKIVDNTKGKIILTSHKYAETPDDDAYDELFGQVKNIGNGTAEDISIIFTYYDVNSNAIGNDDTGIYADILHPGQKSPFQEWRNVENTPDMAYYEIALSWYNSDGTQEYIENVEVTKDPQEKIPIIKNPEQTNNENENFPFFNTDGNNIEELGDEEEADDEDDDDEEDEDNKNDKKNDKDEDDD
jgi:hypothetical protein